MPDDVPLGGEFEQSIQRLTKDLVNAARVLSEHEARFLVDAYYAMQDDRIRSGHQLRTLSQTGEPHDIMLWLGEQRIRLEKQVARALDAYSGASVVGRWARSQVGVGPIIAAGLLAHINIANNPTVGHIWSFAGLNPDTKWEKGQRRPFNARLKVLCAYKLGEAFVKTCNNENSIYGRLYAERKEMETRRNEAGEFAELAARLKASGRYRRETEAAKAHAKGLLPAGHIHARARRWAVKLFLAHYHHVAYENHFNLPPPVPYILTKDEHAHYFGPPGWEPLPRPGLLPMTPLQRQRTAGVPPAPPAAPKKAAAKKAVAKQPAPKKAAAKKAAPRKRR